MNTYLDKLIKVAILIGVIGVISHVIYGFLIDINVVEDKNCHRVQVINMDDYDREFHMLYMIPN